MQSSVAEGRAAVRFPSRLAFRCPKDLPKALELVAVRDNTSAPEWARRALLKALEAEGIRLRAGIVEAQS